MGLPVLRLSSSSTHAVTNTPAEPQAAFRSHSPVTTAFPVLTPGRLPHHPFRGLLSVHSHYGLHGRQVPYKTLYTRGFSRFVTSTAAPVATGRSESCRTGFAPAERQRLGTAHVKKGGLISVSLILLCQIPFRLPVICVCHVLECHTS